MPNKLVEYLMQGRLEGTHIKVSMLPTCSLQVTSWVDVNVSIQVGHQCEGIFFLLGAIQSWIGGQGEE